MIAYLITGALKETGQTIHMKVVATDQENALEQANGRGVLVSSVKFLGDETLLRASLAAKILAGVLIVSIPAQLLIHQQVQLNKGQNEAGDKAGRAARQEMNKLIGAAPSFPELLDKMSDATEESEANAERSRLESAIYSRSYFSIGLFFGSFIVSGMARLPRNTG